MPMDSDRMANAIADALDADGQYPDAAAKADSLDLLKLLCAEIIAEIDDHAELNSVSTGTEGVID